MNILSYSYKDLVSVYRHPKTDKITVGSHVFEVKAVEGGAGDDEGSSSSSTPLFPKDSNHNFCYISVDPRRRIVHYWYGAFMTFW